MNDDTEKLFTEVEVNGDEYLLIREAAREIAINSIY